MVCGFLAFGAAALAAPTIDRSSPSAVVKSFYAWYMQHSWVSQIHAARPYFTANLYTTLATAVRNQRCLDEAIVDYDPWNGSQIATVSYVVGTAVVHGNAASVPVHVMLSMVRDRKPFAGSPVTVFVVRGPAGWQIDDVASSGGRFAVAVRSDLKLPSKRPLTAAERTCLTTPI